MSGTLAALLFTVLVAAAAGLFVVVRRRHRTELDERQRDYEQTLRDLRERQTSQVQRLDRERERIERTAHLDLAEDLLAALDDFDSVLEAESLDDDLEQGLEMIRRKLVGTLADHGIERVEPEPADEFDPERHEALRAVDPDDAEPGTVVACHRPGYRFDDRLLRPAAVDVAVGREESDSASERGRGRADDDEPERKEAVAGESAPASEHDATTN